uniref:Uncharacterized protein n=1 Tax=viral metagenome TaxID=1070528 RepID=A0A6C0I4G8_9ZZZZ
MSSERRSIVAVITQLLTVIPEDEEKELSEKLIKYRDSLWNQAPERLTDTDNWLPVQRILSEHILEIETPWKEYAFKIFNNTLE